MKIVAFCGSSKPGSYNQNLIKYLRKKYINEMNIQILDIDDLPFLKFMKYEDLPSKVKYVCESVKASDGIVIATPEINHGMTANIKNVIDWCSMFPPLLYHKPIMLMGASTGPLGTVRAQMQLREVLESPMIDAHVTHSTECLVVNAQDKFDEHGNLNNQKSIDVMEEQYQEFAKLVNERNKELAHE
ncbi:NADPH-dependent FMN reductase [Companilactobacillus ginsenosidimutans]|uniref:NADPH-dependent FMN reductase n=1 Tax=Companilactobacillus ginsenosidimutans TaxID=1007676 RepID=UPI0006611B96|nr:NAD(P)H-dependent oxidoreductase [Companilactobacillus ginsenosidimutans]